MVQQLAIRLDVGGHCGKIEVGPDWTQFPGSYVESAGDDDGSQFPLVKREQIGTGGRRVRDYLPNRLGGAEE